MYDHDSAVYKNNCLRPAKKITQPVQFDQRFLHELHNEVTSKLNKNLKANLEERRVGDMKTFLDFVDSIPEYDDVNHLSNREFYKKLDTLKEKHREFCEYLNRKIRLETTVEEFWWGFLANKTVVLEQRLGRRLPEAGLEQGKNPPKNLPRRWKCLGIRKGFGASQAPIQTVRGKHAEQRIWVVAFPDQYALKPPASNPPWSQMPPKNHLWRASATRRSLLRLKVPPTRRCGLGKVRMESPFPGRFRWPSGTGNTTKKSRNNVTFRDEENKIVDELFLQVQKPSKDKAQMFRAHEVPIESQVPLFDKIMEDQQKR